MGESGPNAPFIPIFLGLGWPWVGELVGFVVRFICFPAQHNLVNRKHPTNLVAVVAPSVSVVAVVAPSVSVGSRTVFAQHCSPYRTYNHGSFPLADLLIVAFFFYRKYYIFYYLVRGGGFFWIFSHGFVIFGF